MTEFKQRSLSELNVTNGKNDLLETTSGFLSISGPQTRAVEKGGNATAAMLRFRYRGHSKRDKPLSSGEIRRQIGLKMRANNSCNLLYIMWQIETQEKLVVSLKSNPGKSTHKDCGSKGYTTLKSNIKTSGLFAGITAKDHKTHCLVCQITPKGIAGFEVIVHIDNKLIWRSAIENLHSEIVGPAGFRTDNGNFIFKFFTKM